MFVDFTRDAGLMVDTGLYPTQVVLKLAWPGQFSGDVGQFFGDYPGLRINSGSPDLIPFEDAVELRSQGDTTLEIRGQGNLQTLHYRLQLVKLPSRRGGVWTIIVEDELLEETPESTTVWVETVRFDVPEYGIRVRGPSLWQLLMEEA